VKVENMKYPLSLKKGDKIGITAPSSGVEGIFIKRIDSAIKQLHNLGYECV